MADSSIDQRLGNYRLIRLLGHGGFADVYLGEHIYLKTQAAIKVLHTQLQPEDIEKFRSEALTIAHLIHPHIIRVLDFDVENAAPFLVMDYAPNDTLRHRHPRGTRLPSAVFLSYVKQVAAALQYAHDQKLVHRDIKPENMLLGRSIDVLLSDFGIAVVAQSSRYQQSGQEIGGTIAYMAPEQLQGRAIPASDQYSLGIVVYEWLSGERPFQGSFPEIASQHMLVPPAPLRSKIPALPYIIEEVVQRALNKDPQQRFMRVEAFANALMQACQGVAPLPYQPVSQPIAPRQSLSNFEVTAPDQSSQSTYVMPSRQTSSSNFGVIPPAQATPDFAGMRPDQSVDNARFILPGQSSPNFGVTTA